MIQLQVISQELHQPPTISDLWHDICHTKPLLCGGIPERERELGIMKGDQAGGRGEGPGHASPGRGKGCD